MRIILILLFNYIFWANSFEQNLVLNNSFEMRDCNQIGVDSLNGLCLTGWFVPNYSSIDWYSETITDRIFCVPNTYLGFHPAFDGQSYIGLVLFSWSGGLEHFVGSLAKPLSKDSIYKVSFYIRYAGDMFWIKSKKAEILFTKDRPKFNDRFYESLFNPRINSNTGKLKSDIAFNIEAANNSNKWVQCSAIYKAKGGEKYLTLGFFYQNEQFFKLCNKYIQIQYSPKKKSKFLKNQYLDPIYTNTNFKVYKNLTDVVEAYYFIDAVSVTPIEHGSEEDFTF